MFCKESSFVRKADISEFKIQSNLNGLNNFGIMEKFIRDMGSSSHWGLIMAPVQEANSDNLHSDCMLSVLIRIASVRQF